MSDLIERLKAAGNELAGFDGSGGLYHEAAGRIAELEAEVLHENDLFITWRDKAETLQTRIAELQELLELWMLYYTDGIPDDELRDLYCASVEALGGDDDRN